MTKTNDLTMTDATLTLRLSSELKSRLEALSSDTKRSKSFLANYAIEQFVAEEEAHIEGVKTARAELRAGKGVAHEDAIAELDRAIEAAVHRPSRV